jgi:hypothetical protein
MRLSKVLLWCLAGTVVLTIAVPVVVAFTPLAAWVDYRMIIFVGAYIVLFATIALGCAIVMERGRAVRWMRSGLIACVACGVGWPLFVFLSDWRTEELWFLVLVWPTCWAGLMLVVGILLLPRNRGGWWTSMRRVTIVLTSLLGVQICFSVAFYWIGDEFGLYWAVLVGRPTTWLALMLVGSLVWLLVRRSRLVLMRRLLMISIILLAAYVVIAALFLRAPEVVPDSYWTPSYDYEETAIRIAAILALLAGGGAFTTLIIIWIPGLTGQPQPDALLRSFGLRCPRCGHEQTAQTGEYSCRQCGMSIKVELL